MWRFLWVFTVVFCVQYANLYPQVYEQYQIPEYGFQSPISSSDYDQMETRQSVFSLGSCKVVLNPICPDPDITFYLYTKNNPEVPEYIRVGSDDMVSNLTSSSFNAALPTKIIIHGYNSDMNLPALTEIRKEYLKENNLNVFMVDWSPLVMGPCYPGAVWNARHAGNCAAQLVQRIRELGATDIHVLGFSLGAHVTNYVATALRPYKVPRITGLDPALPGFITASLDDKLDPSDADFVDVLHTNAFMQGKVQESGHVDFYLNGGVIQPGCWAENRFFACNHHRAPLYFAESINTNRGFWGWPCPSYLTYLLGRCPPKDPQIVMGEHVTEQAKGVYLVITESVPPYAVGKYDGPAIEILLKSENNRKDILKKYKKHILDYLDEDSLMEENYEKRQELNNELLNEMFSINGNYSDVFDITGYFK